MKTHMLRCSHTRQQEERRGSKEGGVLHSCTEFVNTKVRRRSIQCAAQHTIQRSYGPERNDCGSVPGQITFERRRRRARHRNKFKKGCCRSEAPWKSRTLSILLQRRHSSKGLIGRTCNTDTPAPKIQRREEMNDGPTTTPLFKTGRAPS
jgi:hypothetical protein